eukprot:2678200-Pleurochrysis_carterae.AAC.3
MAKLGELQQILSRLEVALEIGHDHELAPPLGLGGEDADIKMVSVCKLEGQELGQFLFVKGEGFEAVVGRRATVRLHCKELPSVRLKVDTHGGQGARSEPKRNAGARTATGSIGTAVSRGAMAACAQVKCAEERARMTEECPGASADSSARPSEPAGREPKMPIYWRQLRGACCQ